MYIQNNDFLEAQVAYLESRDPKDFIPMYLMITDLSSHLIKKYLRTHGLHISSEEIETKAHSAACSIFGLYQRDPLYRIENICARLFWECKYELLIDKQYEDSISYDDLVEVTVPGPEDYIEENMDFVSLEKILNEEDFERVLESLYRSKYFKNTLKEIMTYKSKTWMYANVHDLKLIHTQMNISKGVNYDRSKCREEIQNINKALRAYARANSNSNDTAVS